MLGIMGFDYIIQRVSSFVIIVLVGVVIGLYCRECNFFVIKGYFFSGDFIGCNIFGVEGLRSSVGVQCCGKYNNGSNFYVGIRQVELLELMFVGVLRC